MNNEFNKDDDNEVVDSIPSDAKHFGEEENISPYNQSTNRRNQSFNTTKIIIEHGPASLLSKAAFICALGSVIFFLFPGAAFTMALLGAGMALVNISCGYNGKVVSVFAIGISILGGILASFSSILWLFLHSLFNLFS